MEAMRAGTPVVVTNVPGNRIVVRARGERVGGASRTSPTRWPATMGNIVENPTLGQEVGSTAGARAWRGFEVGHMAAATAAVYQELWARAG